MYKFILKPQDVLFFRDGKPFGTDASFAETIFPPNPPSLMGSLRALIIDTLGGYEEFKNGKIKLLDPIGTFVEDKEVGDENKKKKIFSQRDGLKIKRIYISKKKTVYFPAPSDVGYIEVGNEKILKPFKWIERDKLPFSGKEEFDYIIYNNSEFEIEPLKSKYMASDIMKEYLLGRVPHTQRKCSLVDESEFYENEEQIKNRLERDKKVTRNEGGIFMYKVKRMKEGVEINVEFETKEVDGKRIPIDDVIEKIKEYSSKFITLGGEGRVAEYELKKDDGFLNCGISFDEFKKVYDSSTDVLKLVLITPSIVERKFPKELENHFEIKGISSKGIVSIGGWDTSRKLPKTMYKAYLAGTVFLVEPKKEFNEDFYNEVLNTNFSDDFSDDIYLKPFEGFGAVLIGVEKKIKGGK